MELVDLLKACCVVTGQDFERVKQKGRYREIVFTRHLFFYMARHYFGAKLREIKNIFGFDHSTVLHGLELVNDLLYVNDQHTIDCIDRIHDYVGKHYQLDKKLTVYVPFSVEAGKIAEMLQNKFNCRVVIGTV